MKPIIAVLLLLSPVLAQAPATKQQHAIVTAWNAVGDSFSKENEIVDELNRDMHASPPWRVLDASRDHVKHRAELIDKIIAEHKRRIELFEKLKAADSAP